MILIHVEGRWPTMVFIFIVAALTACHDPTLPPADVEVRAVRVTGVVDREEALADSAEIEFIPDPTGACPAADQVTSSLAPEVTVPVAGNGEFSAGIVLEFQSEGGFIPDEVCVHVRVFLEGAEPDTAFNAGPWAVGSDLENPPTAELTIDFGSRLED